MPFHAIAGQNKAIATLKAICESNQVGSGYLFEGPNGVGKKLVAIAFAQAMLCDTKPAEGCGVCTTCVRVASGSHPDVRVVEPRSDGNHSLQVEYVREDLLRYVQFAPFEAKHAFVIVVDADICFPSEHPESANALLKALEEPRAQVHFILTTERPSKLLITLRSRCQRIRFSPLDDGTLLDILLAHEIADEKAKVAVAIAGGSAHRALMLASDEGLAALLAAQALDEAVASKKQGTLIKMSEELSKNESLPTILDILLVMYRDRIADALGMPDKKSMLNADAHRLVQRPSNQTINNLTEGSHLLGQAKATLEGQANTQIVLDSLLLSLTELV